MSEYHIPEFDPEKLSKKELLLLIKDLMSNGYFRSYKHVRVAAFNVREKTLWQGYQARAAEVKAASDKMHATGGKGVRYYDALAEYMRGQQASELAYQKYKTFSDQNSGSSKDEAAS